MLACATGRSTGCSGRRSKSRGGLRRISLLTLPRLTLLDSNFPGNSLDRQTRIELRGVTPSSHSKNSLSKICSQGWVALQGNAYTICAKNFQGLGPKRPESWIANWVFMRGWRNKVGNLIESFWPKKHHLPHVIGICVKNRGVRFHQILDVKQYSFNSIPPTSHI